MIIIGLWSVFSVKQSKDFLVGGGKLPWQVGGLSHHVGGYSAVVFTAYVMYCYRDGFSMFIWWALGFAFACFMGAWLIAPKWCRLRQLLEVQSPTEYLALRYNVPAQQTIVWLGTVLKLLDLAGKTLAMATILYGFANVPIYQGILITGGVSLAYTVMGGFMASARNDVFQFLVQLAGGLLMFFFVLSALQMKFDCNYITMWNKLPVSHMEFLSKECDLFFAIGFWIALFFAANGGNWGSGLRFMAAPSPDMARKTAVLSGHLYFLWPLILFAPMWASPLFYPDEKTPEVIYTIMAKEFLPAGLIGVVLASMFAASISTIAADCNAISGVIARDIAPQFQKKLIDENGQTPLWFVRTVSFFLAAGMMAIAFFSGDGGIVKLVIKWFSGLVTPISVPLIFGMFYCFRKCGPAAAILSTVTGFAVFLGMEGYCWMNFDKGVGISNALFYPAVSSIAVYVLVGLILPRQPEEKVDNLLKVINNISPDSEFKAADMN